MMYCAGCGQMLKDNTKFCMRCGRAIGGIGNQPPPSAAPANPSLYESGYLPKKRGTPEWIIVLVALGLVVFLGGCCLLTSSLEDERIGFYVNPRDGINFYREDINAPEFIDDEGLSW